MPKRPDLDYQSSNAEPSTPPSTFSPLAILLKIMNGKFDARDFDGAVAIARIAAPYLHPRAPAAPPAAEFAGLLDAELDALNARD